MPGTFSKTTARGLMARTHPANRTTCRFRGSFSVPVLRFACEKPWQGGTADQDVNIPPFEPEAVQKGMRLHVFQPGTDRPDPRVPGVGPECGRIAVQRGGNPEAGQQEPERTPAGPAVQVNHRRSSPAHVRVPPEAGAGLRFSAWFCPAPSGSP